MKQEAMEALTVVQEEVLNFEGRQHLQKEKPHCPVTNYPWAYFEEIMVHISLSTAGNDIHVLYNSLHC